MLISYLSTQNMALPFKNMPELVSKSNFRVATSPGSTYAESFSASEDPIWQTIWNERMEPYLEEYRPYDAKKNWNDLLKADAETALYYDYLSVRYRVSVQGIKSLGGHLHVYAGGLNFMK